MRFFTLFSLILCVISSASGEETFSAEFDPPTPPVTAPLTTEQTRARTAYSAALTALREAGQIAPAGTRFVTPVMNGLNLLESARSWLSANGVAFSDDGAALTITPQANGHALNRFAHNSMQRFQTQIMYSPFKIGPYDGAYYSSERTIYLTHESILTAGTTTIEIHEQLHARFHALRRQGIISPYHITFASRGSHNITDYRLYANAMSAEELSAYTLNATQGLSRITMALRNGSSLEQLAPQIRQAANISRMTADLSQATQRLTTLALHALNDPTKSRTIAHPDGLTSLEIDIGNDQVVRVPIVSAEERRELLRRSRAENPTLTDAQRREALMPELRAKARQQLNNLNLIANCARDTHAAIRNILAAPTLAKVRDALARIRALNLEINGEGAIRPRTGQPLPLAIAPATRQSDTSRVAGVSGHGQDTQPDWHGVAQEGRGGVAPLSRGRSGNHVPLLSIDFDGQEFEGFREAPPEPAQRQRPSPPRTNLRQAAAQFRRDAINFARMPASQQQLVLRSGGPLSVAFTMVGIGELYKLLGQRLESLHTLMENDKARCEQEALERAQVAWHRQRNRRWTCGESDQWDHPKVIAQLRTVGERYWPEYVRHLQETGQALPQTSDEAYRKAGAHYQSSLFLASYLDVREDGSVHFPGACKYINVEFTRNWYDAGHIRSVDILMDFSRTPPHYFDLRTRRYVPTSLREIEARERGRITNWPTDLSYINDQERRLNEAKDLDEVDCRNDDQRSCDSYTKLFGDSAIVFHRAISDCRRGQRFTNQVAVERAIATIQRVNPIVRATCPNFEPIRSNTVTRINALIAEGMPRELFAAGGGASTAEEESVSQRFRDFCDRIHAVDDQSTESPQSTH